MPNLLLHTGHATIVDETNIHASNQLFPTVNVVIDGQHIANQPACTGKFIRKFRAGTNGILLRSYIQPVTRNNSFWLIWVTIKIKLVELNQGSAG